MKMKIYILKNIFLIFDCFYFSSNIMLVIF